MANTKRSVSAGLMVFGLILLLTNSVSASTITFTGSDSYGRAATATFTLNSGVLTIALSNTATYDAMNPTDMLTALFFNIGGVTLTPVSALLGQGSVVINTLNGGIVNVPGGNVGGEWGYGSGFNVDGSRSGTSSSGFGLFGDPNFNGTNLQGPEALDGVQYGITTAGDIIKSGNGGIKSNQSSQFIKNEVLLTLNTVPTDFSLSSINDVRFQYGTALTEAHIPGTPTSPVPDGGSTLALLGSALAGIGLLRRKIRTA